ncbi:hypothetical protein PC121_g13289 [Phytophthora cactorum]|nr:hypothetical protein PC121_g13289 [Phytophthora cactorum]
MDGSLLVPPNSYSFSDTVIEVVPARRRHPQTYLFNGLDGERGHQALQATRSRQTSDSTGLVSTQRIPSPSSHLHFSDSAHAAQASAHTALTNPEGSLNALDPAERSLMLHRLRRRRTQQRYRMKIQNKAVSLEDEVVQLREEVERLEKKRYTIHSTVPTKITALKVVVEYFRLFQNGFHPVASVSDLCNATTALRDDPGYVQTQFFQAVTVPDVLFNAGYGVEAALEDWRLVSLYHANQTINLERVERGVGNTVVAYMNGVFTITEMMLHSAFPDLESDSEGRKWLGLAEKLLDKQFVVPSMVCYQFDEANRVVSGRYEANMLAPLLELLPSAEDVSLVLSSPINIHHWSKVGG